jgi:hypothetical protein
VSPPISTACLGAAGAFFVANLTNFRGAAELGLIAGGGLLLCLAAGYTLLPALLTLLPANVGKVAEEERYHDPAKAATGGGWRLGVAGLWLLAAVVGAWAVGVPGFDSNLIKLQASGLESVKLVHKLPTWSAAVMTEDLNTLRAARDALTPKEGEASLIDSSVSVIDAIDKQAWLAKNNAAFAQVKWEEPTGPSAEHMELIADAMEGVAARWGGAGEFAALHKELEEAAEKLREGKDDAVMRGRVEAWQKAFWNVLKSNLARFIPGLLDVTRLPEGMQEHFVSFKGKPGSDKPGGPTYALYIYPKENLWEQSKLKAFVEELERRREAAGNANFSITGIAVQLLYSTREIHRAFILATLYSIVLIFVLVMIDLRRLGQTLLALSVLLMGLPMLIVMMWVWHTLPVFRGQTLEMLTDIPSTWNFANFFGLPILIGAGHEYGVFMVHRYKETLDDPRRVWGRWDVSDRALLLCAIVTSCSFGFLMMAGHRGLASLGWVMAVGSACIYTATVLVLRPVLHWLLKRKRVYERVR